MTRSKRAAVAIVGAAITAASFGLGGIAFGLSLGGGPPTAPAPAAGPAYVGPVHMCVSTANESTIYVEEHSTAEGNCTAGDTQFAANELTPQFALTIGSVTYTCTADTAQRQTAITCPAPSPSPSSTSSPSPTSTSTG